jgi:hypothetical protein
MPPQGMLAKRRSHPTPQGDFVRAHGVHYGLAGQNRSIKLARHGLNAMRGIHIPGADLIGNPCRAADPEVVREFRLLATSQAFWAAAE